MAGCVHVWPCHDNNPSNLDEAINGFEKPEDPYSYVAEKVVY